MEISRTNSPDPPIRMTFKLLLFIRLGSSGNYFLSMNIDSPSGNSSLLSSLFGLLLNFCYLTFLQ